MGNFKEVNQQEVPIMAVNYSAMNNQPCYCVSTAAAGTSAVNCEILGTVILAVSIFVRLIALLVLKV